MQKTACTCNVDPCQLLHQSFHRLPWSSCAFPWHSLLIEWIRGRKWVFGSCAHEDMLPIIDAVCCYRSAWQYQVASHSFCCEWNIQSTCQFCQQHILCSHTLCIIPQQVQENVLLLCTPRCIDVVDSWWLHICIWMIIWTLDVEICWAWGLWQSCRFSCHVAWNSILFCYCTKLSCPDS